MYLKITNGHDKCRIVQQVVDVTFDASGLEYTCEDGARITTRIEPACTVYVLNDQGKTIDSYSPPTAPDVIEGKPVLKMEVALTTEDTRACGEQERAPSEVRRPYRPHGPDFLGRPVPADASPDSPGHVMQPPCQKLPL